MKFDRLFGPETEENVRRKLSGAIDRIFLKNGVNEKSIQDAYSATQELAKAVNQRGRVRITNNYVANLIESIAKRHVGDLMDEEFKVTGKWSSHPDINDAIARLRSKITSQ